MDKWIILHNAPMPEPALFGDDDRPVLFDTEKAAMESMVEDYIAMLNQQLQDYMIGDRDNIDLQCEEWVEPCTLHEDGSISTEMYEDLYDPKTYVR